MLMREAGLQGWHLTSFSACAGRCPDPAELGGPEPSSPINVPGMPTGFLEAHELCATCADSSPLFPVFVLGITVTISIATVSNSIYFVFSFPLATSLIIIKSF